MLSSSWCCIQARRKEPGVSWRYQGKRITRLAEPSLFGVGGPRTRRHRQKAGCATWKQVPIQHRPRQGQPFVSCMRRYTSARQHVAGSDGGGGAASRCAWDGQPVAFKVHWPFQMYARLKGYKRLPHRLSQSCRSARCNTMFPGGSVGVVLGVHVAAEATVLSDDGC